VGRGEQRAEEEDLDPRWKSIADTHGLVGELGRNISEAEALDDLQLRIITALDEHLVRMRTAAREAAGTPRATHVQEEMRRREGQRAEAGAQRNRNQRHKTRWRDRREREVTGLKARAPRQGEVLCKLRIIGEGHWTAIRPGDIQTIHLVARTIWGRRRIAAPERELQETLAAEWARKVISLEDRGPPIEEEEIWFWVRAREQTGGCGWEGMTREELR
jgi:hypothetical protein